MSLYMGLRRVFASGIKLLFGMRVRGREEIPEQGRVILCSNHRSLADPILLGMSIKKRQVRYMAKAELFQKKAAGRFLRALGAFPVRRGTGDQQAMAYAQEILQQEGMLGIFPQGHIIPAGVPFAPKSGVAALAYAAKAPVLPVCIYCKGDIKPFCGVTVHFGKLIPYEAFGFTDGNRQELKAAAALVAERVNALLEQEAGGMPEQGMPERDGAV